MKILGLVAGAALLLGAQGAYAATIKNGSFENGTPSNSTSFTNQGFSTEAAGSGALQDWTITSGSVDYIGSYWGAQQGSRSLDLSGGAPGTISQTLTDLVVGQEYKLSFYIRGNTDGGPDPQTLLVTLGGITSGFAAQQVATWVLTTFTFTYDGDSGDNVLTFAAGPNGPYGPGLDNITIAATPIPGAILLFGSALGGLGFLGYRRKKQDAAA